MLILLAYDRSLMLPDLCLSSIASVRLAVENSRRHRVSPGARGNV